MAHTTRPLLLQPRWIAAAVCVVALATACVFLGRWQFHRLEERKANNTIARVNIDAPVAPIRSVIPADGTVSKAVEWRRVSIRGHYLPDHQILAAYRSVDGPGFEYVCMFRATDGSTVLVDRGFAPRAPGSDAVPPAPPLPGGEVTVVGRLKHSERGNRNAVTMVNNQVRLVNGPAISKVTGIGVLDGYVTLVPESVPKPLTPLPLPELDSGPHLFYAIQWVFFALLALVGLVHFTRLELAERRGESKPPRRSNRHTPVSIPGDDESEIGNNEEHGPRTGG